MAKPVCPDKEHTWIYEKGTASVQCVYCKYWPHIDRRLQCSKCYTESCLKCLDSKGLLPEDLKCKMVVYNKDYKKPKKSEEATSSSLLELKASLESRLDKLTFEIEKEKLNQENERLKLQLELLKQPLKVQEKQTENKTEDKKSQPDFKEFLKDTLKEFKEEIKSENTSILQQVNMLKEEQQTTEKKEQSFKSFFQDLIQELKQERNKEKEELSSLIKELKELKTSEKEKEKEEFKECSEELIGNDNPAGQITKNPFICQKTDWINEIKVDCRIKLVENPQEMIYCRALVDSGATMNIIDSEVIPSSWIQKSEPVIARGITGEKHEYNTKLKDASISFITECYTSSDETPITDIYPRDTLKKLGVTLILGLKYLTRENYPRSIVLFNLSY